MITRRDVIAIAGAAALVAGWRCWPSGDRAIKIRREPLQFRITPFARTADLLNENILNTVRSLLSDGRLKMGYGSLLHWLHVFGVPQSAEFQPDLCHDVVDLLTNASRIEEHFGDSSVIVPTRTGVRILHRTSREQSASARPSHPYQAVAIFGEAGLPSSTPVFSLEASHTLEDVIRDCLSNLQIRESSTQEPEWPMQAIAHYLPPAKSWKNRWGEEISIDRFATFLLDRDVASFSCGGTHVLQSLGLLLQANEQHQILSAQLDDRVRQACRAYSQTIESTQHSDGAWRKDWTDDGPGLDYGRIGIHLTGHILEAQLYLPETLRISNSAAMAGLRYLVQQFQIADSETVSKNYCFYSHAGNTLLRCS